MPYTKRTVRADLNMVLGVIITLIIIGLLFIYSASSVYALDRFGCAAYFFKKQLVGFGLGIFALLFFCMVPLDLVQRLSPYLFLGSLLLTGLTLISRFSVQIYGSSRWLNAFGFAFQPSELLKFSLVIYVAYIIAKKEQQRTSFLHGYLPFLCILAITSGILLKQPDFGLTITLCATIFLLLFIAEFKSKYLLITLATSLPAIIGLVIFKPYRMKRILTFLNPWEDPQGSGFQIIQSLIAIGSGHWIGTGIAQSNQKFFYLPMLHTDFIFAIIAEETGFIGCFILVFLYSLFLYFGMRIAWHIQDLFSAFIVFGFVILVTMQTLINFFVSTGLLPTKGIGLPFVSFGSSGLIALLCLLGVVINCVLESRT